jgi:hypothetical protein
MHASSDSNTLSRLTIRDARVASHRTHRPTTRNPPHLGHRIGPGIMLTYFELKVVLTDNAWTRGRTRFASVEVLLADAKEMSPQGEYYQYLNYSKM